MNEAKSNYSIYGLESVYLYSILSTVIFFVLGIFVLLFGHPHEDAYILYIYSEMLASNGIIQYFLAGPPAEGATDFLWMIIISCLNFIGVPSGYASLGLNSIGVFLLSLIVMKVSKKYGNSKLSFFIIAVTIPFYNTTQAAYAGFSVALYSALLALLFVLSLSFNGKSVIAVSIVALIVALFRPDGAVIGPLVCILLFFFLDEEEKRYHLRASSFCIFVGIFYFIWRWNYFGLILPLPLIVKSHSDALLPGLMENLRWVGEGFIFVICGICALIVINKGRTRLVIATLPYFLYFFAIAFATQSQNISNRFQAPLGVILILAAAICLQFLIDKMRDFTGLVKGFIVLLLFFLAGVQVYVYASQTSKLIKYLTNNDYINFFPYHLANFTNEETTIALTEAGRFAYWLEGQKFDLVGLNTAETAVSGASSEYINAIQPDLLFFHQANTLPSINCLDERDYCEISREELVKIASIDQTLDYLGSKSRVMMASAAAVDYLMTTETTYRIFLVLYGSKYSHIYALREEGSLEVEDFLSSLEVSFSQSGQLSYTEMIGWR